MEDEKVQTHAPREILDAEAIQSLDTARMALRWALERLHKLEQEKAALCDAAKAAERDKSRSQDEYAALQKTIALRGAEANQRELYYAKMEEFLSLQLQGKLDVAALARRELETQSLQELLQHKEGQLERELSARRAALERELQKLRTDLEQDARTRRRQTEQSAELQRSTLEQEHLSRMAEVHEKEIGLKQESGALAERQAHFEEYYAAQRAQLNAAVKTFRGEVEGQVQFRVQMAERILSERYAALEGGWSQEKALLVKELDSWRRRSQELTPRVIELEKSLAAAEDALRRARAAVDGKTLSLEELRRAAQDELAAAQVEAAHWKERASRQVAELLEARQNLAIVDEGLKQMQGLAQSQAARFDEAQKTAQAQMAALAAETDDWRKRFEAAAAKAQEEARGAAVLEEALAQSRRACELQAGMIEERRLAWDEERKVLLAELADARERLGEAVDEAAELETKAAQAAAGQTDARAETERLAARLAEARSRAEESAARRLELEKGLSRAEEAEAVLARHVARLEQQRAAWDDERAGLQLELGRAVEDAAARSARGLELERRLAAADEALRQARAAGERQAARIDEQRRAEEAERDELRARVASLSPKSPSPPFP